MVDYATGRLTMFLQLRLECDGLFSKVLFVFFVFLFLVCWFFGSVDVRKACFGGPLALSSRARALSLSLSLSLSRLFLSHTSVHLPSAIHSPPCVDICWNIVAIMQPGAQPQPQPPALLITCGTGLALVTASADADFDVEDISGITLLLAECIAALPLNIQIVHWAMRMR